MTFEQLDTVRGYCIAAVIVAIVVIGLSFSLTPSRTSYAQRLLRVGAGLIGGGAGLTIFFIFSFITGWEEYYATKTAVRNIIEYKGRHQVAARAITTLGEMDVSMLGVVFGITGSLLLAIAYIYLRNTRKPY